MHYTAAFVVAGQATKQVIYQPRAICQKHAPPRLGSVLKTRIPHSPNARELRAGMSIRVSSPTDICRSAAARPRGFRHREFLLP